MCVCVDSLKQHHHIFNTETIKASNLILSLHHVFLPGVTPLQPLPCFKLTRSVSCCVSYSQSETTYDIIGIWSTLDQASCVTRQEITWVKCLLAAHKNASGLGDWWCLSKEILQVVEQTKSLFIFFFFKVYKHQFTFSQNLVLSPWQRVEVPKYRLNCFLSKWLILSLGWMSCAIICLLFWFCSRGLYVVIHHFE